MGKVSNALMMYQLLLSGKKYSIKELAEILEVTPRMIKIYKEDLEKAGIYIDSIIGKHGGYILNYKLTSLDVGLSKYDVELLKSLEKKLENDSDYEMQKELKNFTLKILNAYENRKETIAYQKTGKDIVYLEEIVDKYNNINRAVSQKRKIRIKYKSLDATKITVRNIHPCDMFVHNEEWYVSAFCELRQEIRHFRLNRIVKYQILEESF